MKKSIRIILIGALALFMLVGCAAAPATSAGSSAVSSEESTQSTELSASIVEDAVSKRDASGEYEADGAVTLDPDGDLTITEAGVYLLSGHYDGMIVIEAGEEDKVQLVLENAELTNGEGPAIYVKSADKVFLTAAEGTVNTISDGEDYTLTDEDTTLDAAVFDATIGDICPGDWRIFEHNSIDMVRLMVKTLYKTGRLKAEAPVYLTHLARTLHPTQAELERQLEKPFLPCFDGMEAEV